MALNKRIMELPARSVAEITGDEWIPFEDLWENGRISVSGLTDHIGYSIAAVVSANVASTVSGLESRLGTVETAIRDVQSIGNDVSALQVTVSRNSSDIAGLGGRVSTSEAYISDLRPRMTTTESQIYTLQTNYSGLVSTVDTLGGQVSALGGQVSALGGQVDALSSGKLGKDDIVTLSEAEYEALATKDNDKYYLTYEDDTN